MEATTLTDLVWLRRVIATGKATDLRKQAGLSRDELAAAVGTTPTTLRRWELGLARPTGQRAPRYARALRELEEVLAP